MNSVNLIPGEQRRGSSGTPYAVYGVLGGLAAVLLAVTLLVLASNQVGAKQAELAKVTNQANAAEQQARRLSPYTDFAKLQQSRVSTVRSLASTRFDWAHAFTDVTHAVTSRTWLNGLTGTVTAGISVDGDATSTASTVRAADANPAIALVGCAKTNDDVVALLSRLRAMKGVQRVTLADAHKDDTAQPPSGKSDTQSCGSTATPAFTAVVFYAPLKTPSASAGGVDPETPPPAASSGSDSSTDSSSNTSTTSTTASGTP